MVITGSQGQDHSLGPHRRAGCLPGPNAAIPVGWQPQRAPEAMVAPSPQRGQHCSRSIPSRAVLSQKPELARQWLPKQHLLAAVRSKGMAVPSKLLETPQQRWHRHHPKGVLRLLPPHFRMVSTSGCFDGIELSVFTN